MEKTAIDYSKDTERYSQWRVLKTQQVGEFLKLALPPLTQNAPKAKYKQGDEIAKKTMHIIIAIIVSLFPTFIALFFEAYEAVLIVILAWIVILCLLVHWMIIYAQKEVPQKKKFKQHQKDVYAYIAAIDPVAVKQQFALLGEQADALAVELGVSPKALAALRPNTPQDDLAYYRETVANFAKEYELIYQAYIQDRPDPFLDCGLATTPEGAKQKKEDFFGFANALNRIESHEGYPGPNYMHYGDPTHADFLNHHKELSVIK